MSSQESTALSDFEALHLKYAVAFIIMGAIVLLLLKGVLTLIESRRDVSTSDARDIHHVMRVTSAVGMNLAALCSGYLKEALRREHIGFTCHATADGVELVEALAAGDTTLGVMALSDYLRHGVEVNFPASIISVLASQGKDDPSLLVLLAERTYAQNAYDDVRAFVEAYFQLMDRELAAEAAEPGLRYYGREENATRWFSLATHGRPGQDELVNTIDRVVRRLEADADFAGRTVLEQDNPYTLVDSRFLQSLQTEHAQRQALAAPASITRADAPQARAADQRVPDSAEAAIAVLIAWSEGLLGKIIGLAAFVVGLGISATRANPLAAVTGLMVGLLLTNAPEVIRAIVSS